uniref:Uncharacterized protein n=1 Tax=Haemonchus contortus TaxID=6289 RepID=A0A7I4YHD5_HAECO
MNGRPSCDDGKVTPDAAGRLRCGEIRDDHHHDDGQPPQKAFGRRTKNGPINPISRHDDLVAVMSDVDQRKKSECRSKSWTSLTEHGERPLQHSNYTTCEQGCKQSFGWPSFCS